MAKLTETEKAARALRDLHAIRYPLTTWGLVWRLMLVVIWLITIFVRVTYEIPPTWLTPVFAIGFTVLTREIWDGFRRRRHDRWESEQRIKELNKEE